MRISALLFVIFILPQLCFAQSLTSDGINPAPDLELQPAYPSPGEKTTIRFNDYRSNTIGSEIRWFYNNSLITTANDRREVEVVAPAVGQTIVVKMVLTTNGVSEVHNVTLKPLYLDLIIEPQTHVPDFYKGRALPSVGSQINVTALLGNGKNLDTNYIYTWRINGAVYQGEGLRNKNSMSFLMPQGSNTTLSLQVSTYAGVVVAKRTILVPLAKPELHFYEINPLYGIGTVSVGDDFNLISNSAILRGEPYYLDSTVFNNPNVLSWTINGQPTEPDYSNPYQVTMEKTGGGGEASLGFHVRSTIQLLQGIKGNITIHI